jgi:hypothetical protein
MSSTPHVLAIWAGFGIPVLASVVFAVVLSHPRVRG